MNSIAKDLSKYTPAYEPVSSREPTEAEKKLDATLKAFMDKEMKLETDEEMFKRDAVLSEVRTIFLNWVQFIATKVLHMPEEEAEDAGGELFISGSHRLGVRDIGADIDTVCVAPNFCTREHFFSHLKNDFANHPDVTELNAVEGALVPIISFDFKGISIDLLFARLAENTVPKDIDILDDRILKGLDDATEKSLNGPRVTNMIFKLVGEKTFPNFLIVLRCIRKWAKRRGLYGNKLGYLGGINCNILVAFICQLYPNYGPSSLLFRFFKQYKEWKWPEPIMLNNIQQNPPDASLSEQRVIFSSANNPHDMMPIITPAYPAMNSSYSVNKHTFEVMQSEIAKGYELMETIVKQKGACWERLFEGSDFFIKYSHYLACHVVGTGQNSDSRSWIGFVESRIRRIVQYPYLENLPLKYPIQLYPVVSKTQKSDYSICYFVGFNLDVAQISQMGDKNVHIDDVIFRFQ
jgi:poly(A) polymerase